MPSPGAPAACGPRACRDGFKVGAIEANPGSHVLRPNHAWTSGAFYPGVKLLPREPRREGRAREADTRPEDRPWQEQGRPVQRPARPGSGRPSRSAGQRSTVPPSPPSHARLPAWTGAVHTGCRGESATRFRPARHRPTGSRRPRRCRDGCARPAAGARRRTPGAARGGGQRPSTRHRPVPGRQRNNRVRPVAPRITTA